MPEGAREVANGVAAVDAAAAGAPWRPVRATEVPAVPAAAAATQKPAPGDVTDGHRARDLAKRRGRESEGGKDGKGNKGKVGGVDVDVRMTGS